MNAQSPPPLARPDEDVLVGAPPAFDSDALDAPTRRMAIAMTLIFWIANISVQMFRSYLEDHGDMGGLLLARVTTAAGGLGLCFLVHLVIARLGHRSFAARAVVLALIVPIVADACAWLSYLTMAAFAPVSVVRTATSSATIQAVLYWVWFFFAWAALYLALRYSYEVKASERRARIVEGLAHAAQLRALQNQISPHFMFNTLNSISALMLDGKAERAEAMLRRLSDFLRATLALDALSDITLAEELRIQRMYLDIEQARFPDMNVTVDCPDELGDALVPALITQPIVENAVKYGVARSLGPARIDIAASRAEDQLVLAVADDGSGPGQPAAGLGVGLRNVADRLRGRFGAAHRFAAGPTEQGGFRVTLALPLSRTKR
ncbi:sensor histidine kinase [Sphingosinicella sp.]|uniref:sensor histidine kinase n=1 Tax=Sphingosinicella sp. TaxID=1917971 RepID=UPI004037E23D